MRSWAIGGCAGFFGEDRSDASISVLAIRTSLPAPSNGTSATPDLDQLDLEGHLIGSDTEGS